MDYIIGMLSSGWTALVDYLTITRIISLTIAFFLSGAIAQFMSQGAILKYFGKDANKAVSYSIAAVSGCILSVCSCSVLPMFATIRKKGAGIGPAITFLFSGPAINILAITFTFSLIGVDIGFVRVVSAILLAIVIGVIMSLIYSKSEVVDENAKLVILDNETDRKTWQTLVFFVTLIAILLSGVKNPIPTIILTVVLILELIFWFEKDELIEWCQETWDLVKKIFPLFLVGTFLAGIITYVIPSEFMIKFVGDSSFSATIISAVFGAFMYFATLTEVPIVNGFMALGMSKAAATSLLLAGPSLSLPNMIIIGKTMGVKKTLTYVVLVIILSALISTAAGYLVYGLV